MVPPTRCSRIEGVPFGVKGPVPGGANARGGQRASVLRAREDEDQLPQERVEATLLLGLEHAHHARPRTRQRRAMLLSERSLRYDPLDGGGGGGMAPPASPEPPPGTAGGGVTSGTVDGGISVVTAGAAVAGGTTVPSTEAAT